MEICRCNRAGKEETVPIDQCAQFVPAYLFYSHHSQLIPFFRWDILRIRRTMGKINFPDLVPGSAQVEEDRLVHPFSQSSRWYR